MFSESLQTFARSHRAKAGGTASGDGTRLARLRVRVRLSLSHRSIRQTLVAVTIPPIREAVRDALWHLPPDIRDYSFRALRRFRPVRERVTLGEYRDHVEREHVARYEFASTFCAGKRVADMACGTGYGMRILAGRAASVDGYDREPLCGNRVIDLEKERWDDRYDVIVSFETIEHLGDPAFFLENASRTTERLIVSTPVNEFKGYNPHHKQVWTLSEFTRLVERYFRCDYYVQDGEQIRPCAVGRARFVIAIGTPAHREGRGAACVVTKRDS
jgi:SAM-dependent methyltransferase